MSSRFVYSNLCGRSKPRPYEFCVILQGKFVLLFCFQIFEFFSTLYIVHNL